MKWTSLIGALVVTCGVCSQSYGFELLDRMLGSHRGGCNSCADACEPTCEATTDCCDPCADACCDPCCDPCGKKCCHPVRELFAGLRGLFDCGCCDPCGSACCDPCCDPCANACEPSCEVAAACCDSCCDPCAKKRCRGLDLLGLFRHRGCCNSGSSCCSSGCSSCGGGASGVHSNGEDAPVPAAPMPDSSARVRKSTRVHRQVSYRN